MRSGITLKVPVSGQLVDHREKEAVANVDMFGSSVVPEFERAFAKFMGYKYGVFVNSGSSANLLLLGSRDFDSPPLVSGCSFPTTINPLIQSGHRPYLVDIELGTYLPKQVDVACHFLGNFCYSGDVLDSCDGMFPGKDIRSCSFSFYPAHFMTTCEGGMICTNSSNEYMKYKSLRDWGRACWCEPGVDDTCGHRFDHQVDGIEYDHKYTYARIGYNLKATELQAAMGLVQLSKLPAFIEQRIINFNYLYAALLKLEDFFIMPKSTRVNTPWFGFPLTLRDNCTFTRREITMYLESQGIATRLMFGGNITRQPAYHALKLYHDPLPNCDKVMKDGFWFGCWHGLNQDQLDYTIETIYDFVNGNRETARTE
jgi:CDP-6-deoxy-D-xylo-4-hexulose-3-dehydrase